MKKNIILFLCAVASIPYAYAQQVIPRIGLTLSKTAAENEVGIEQKIKPGFTLGAGVEFKITPAFSIQPELNFIRKGFRITFDESDQGVSLAVDNRTTLNYLEIPLLFKVYFGNSATKYFILGGVSAGYGLGGKTKTNVDADLFGTSFSVSTTGKVKFGDPPGNFNPEEDTDLYLDNRFDAGAQFGFGAVINEKFIIEARYNLGFSPFLDDEEDTKNRVIQISFAMPFSAIKGFTTK
jgi:hypothetical protein